MPVYATNDSSIPRVTFTNESRNEPNLSVKKTVIDAPTDAEESSDKTFTFTLKLNGSLASELEYRLYGADGQEKFPPGLNKESYKTTENGEFFLAADEEAVFEWVGRGTNYEITESFKEHYQQVKPAGGLAAIGTIPANGAHVTFENKYSKTDVGAETTDLTVSKVVPFPSGYTLPEINNPDFTFILKVDGKLHQQEPYTVTDTKTGLQVRTGESMADGSFTLKGGETATFPNIPVNVDYEVEEITDGMPEGWRALSESVQGGATVAPATSVEFKNGLASFAVKKTMKDGSKPEDAEFTFLLTNEEHKIWKDAAYYLYSTDGELADNTQHSTAADGTFVLKAGQAAVFIGIPTGTQYNVSEVEDARYEQTLPLSKEGYTDCVVHDAVEILPFENKPAELEGVLTVTKQLDYTQDEAPEDLTKAFTFRLEKKVVASTETGDNTQFADYQPVADQIFYVNVGDYQHNYRTDENGCFSLKANETARFRLPAAEGDEQIFYQVTEVLDGLSLDYTLQGTQETLSGQWTKDGLNFTFTNAYTPDKVNLHLTKMSRTNERLSGAVFTLYEVEEVQTSETKPDNGGDTEEQHPTDDEAAEPILRETEIGTYEVGTDGITIPGLSSGRYRLRETVAPEGYLLLAEPIEIVIERLSRYKEDGSGFDVKVTVSSGEVGTDDGSDFYIEKKYGAAYDELHLIVRNDVIYELPSTGGTGTNHYLLLGITLMFLSASGFYLRKRRAI